MALRQAIFCLTLLVVAVASEIPDCNFFDTVNLTSSKRFTNGSYLYEDILIPAELVATYDYEMKNDYFRENVSSHVRGCACKVKSCIRLCCHLDGNMIEDCTDALADDIQLDPYVNVTYANGSTVRTQVLQDFVAQHGWPCVNAYPLYSQRSDLGKWKLFENGTILTNERKLTKADYCLHPSADESGVHVMQPHICPIIYVFYWYIALLNSGSLILLLLTIHYSTFVLKLQQIHEKCFLCFLASFALMYVLTTPMGFGYDAYPCLFLAYAGYFVSICMPLCMSAVSYASWSSFQGLNLSRLKSTVCFSNIVLIIIGITAVLTFTVFLFDSFVSDADWKPDLAVNCWFDSDNFTLNTFYYLPILIMKTVCISFLILTKRSIAEMNSSLAACYCEVSEDQLRRFNANKAAYYLYVKTYAYISVWYVVSLIDNIFEIFIGYQFYIYVIISANGIIISAMVMSQRRVFQKVLQWIQIRKTSACNEEDSDKGLFITAGNAGNQYLALENLH